ncbi:hypothetical protein [Nonomuraea dietziae]|uniref:hypothetical protein n=1 Tax=Nonomuraea dietziae TaxID=65515 RepID=UPI0033E5B5F5
MTVYDRWHKSHPKPGEKKCPEHKKVPTKNHGKGERWQVRYRDEAGDQRARNFDKKSDAETFDATHKADKARGDWIDPKLGQTRFDDYAAAWMAARLHKPGTIEAYKNALKNHISPTFGALGLVAIRPTAVQH